MALFRQLTVVTLTLLSLLLPLGWFFSQAPVLAAEFPEGEPVLVVLTASWCAKCRDLSELITPMLEDFSQKNISTVMLDVDNPSTTEVSARYGISLSGNDIPQIYLFSGGKTQLMMSAKDYTIGHIEEAQAALAAKLAQSL